MADNVTGVVRAIVGLSMILAAGCSLEPPRAGVGEVCRRDRDCEPALRCLAHECLRIGGGGTAEVPDTGFRPRDAGRDAGPPPDAARDAFVPPPDTGMDTGPVDAGPIDTGDSEDAGLPVDADLPDVGVPLDAP